MQSKKMIEKDWKKEGEFLNRELQWELIETK